MKSMTTLVVFLKKELQLAVQDFLFSPLYLVLKVSIHICSLCFLNCGSSLNIFSIIETSMSANLCPGRLKCSPVALCLSALVMYPLCSEILSTKLLCVSPIYCILHFLHCIQYTIFFCLAIDLL